MKLHYYNLDDFATIFKSLVHLYGMPSQKAAELVYHLNTAAIDTVLYHRNIELKTCDPARFYNEMHRRGRLLPSLGTLGRMLEDVLDNISPSALIEEQRLAVRYAQTIADSISDRAEAKPDIPVNDFPYTLCVNL